jgi:palmitoyltransferase
MLLSNNKTTIENLDKKGKPFKSLYDIGSTNNWYQVFGTNKFLWPFPVFSASGKPLGDGIYWPTNQREEETNSPTTNKRTSISPSKAGANT